MATRKNAAAKAKLNVEPATPREVREWAAENGFEVASRGRIKGEVVEAFTAKTGRPLAAAQ
jgi:nucleoid-associated protein Lsr2